MKINRNIFIYYMPASITSLSYYFYQMINLTSKEEINWFKSIVSLLDKKESMIAYLVNLQTKYVS